MINIASFDIGKKNFAFVVEQVDTSKKITNIPIQQRYNANGTATEKFGSILNEVYKSGKVILHKNVDLTNNCDKKKRLDPETYHNMVDVLNEYDQYWSDCSIIIIEEQMAFRGKHNPMAVKLGQHCYSYFVCNYGRNKQIIEFPSYNKTQILGAEKTLVRNRYKAMDKPQRKKWSISKCLQILEYRQETEILQAMKKNKKLDDLADVITQLQAFKYLYFVDK